VKSIRIECIETLRAKKKNVPAVVKNEKLKKEKRVTVISAYHKDETHVAMGNVNEEETACGCLQFQCQHVRGGSEGSTATAILAVCSFY
jgi:hypothetical protein